MTTSLTVPDIGDYTDLAVIEIAISPGMTIAPDDIVLTLESDKATMDIPAEVGGEVTEVLVKVGDKVNKGTIIANLKEGASSQSAPKENTAVASAPVADTNKALVTVPDIGTPDKVKIIEIAVQVGSNVLQDDTLLTLESDKASMDIPAPQAGTVDSIQVKLGDAVQTGDAILTLAAKDSPTEASTQIATEVATEVTKPKPEVVESPVAAAPAAGNVHAGPGVRRLAQELGIDLSTIQGSGRKGRIVQDDVAKQIKAMLANTPIAAPATQNSLTTAPQPNVDFAKFGPIRREPVSRIKKLSGSYLHRNWVTIPHVTHFDEIDITELEEFRQQEKGKLEAEGLRLTPLVFLMLACCKTLQKFPLFNASLSPKGDEFILKDYYHIGVAVDTPNGLVVPVVRDVDKKGLFELAKELAVISSKAREGSLSPSDMQGGTFSISSLGGIGGTNFTPIVNLPEVAILGVAKSSYKPVYSAGEFKPRLVLPVALSYDHRVIDGAEAARFTKDLHANLADIRRLLL